MSFIDYTYSREIVTFNKAYKSSKYSYYNPAIISSVPEDLFDKQLEKEIRLLKSLPIDPPIFVAHDIKNKRLLSVLICGPQGTPYEGGLFPFSIYLPEKYPNIPCKIVYMAKDEHRINPSIYACGKVMCSLLGSWSGSESEKWNPEISTIYQVLISIQSMFFVEEPYFLEPGFERSYGTENAILKSNIYNGRIAYFTLKFAILDILTNCIAEFKDVSRIYFKQNKEQIQNFIAWYQCEHANKFKDSDVATIISNILEELNKL